MELEERENEFAGQAVIPFEGQSPGALMPIETQQAAPFASSANILSAIDRLGGIEGIFTFVGKLQQLFGMVKTMAPAFRMIGSLMSPKAVVKGSAAKQRKRRTVKRRTGANRANGASGRKRTVRRRAR